eukprot:7156718-Pyramimonas_sp.AAC.1
MKGEAQGQHARAFVFRQRCSDAVVLRAQVNAGRALEHLLVQVWFEPQCPSCLCRANLLAFPLLPLVFELEVRFHRLYRDSTEGTARQGGAQAEPEAQSAAWVHA